MQFVYIYIKKSISIPFLFVGFKPIYLKLTFLKFFTISVLLPTLHSIPIAPINTDNDVPPAEMNSIGIPVGGIEPINISYWIINFSIKKRAKILLFLHFFFMTKHSHYIFISNYIFTKLNNFIPIFRFKARIFLNFSTFLFKFIKIFTIFHLLTICHV